jgi:hypothetical protein
MTDAERIKKLRAAIKPFAKAASCAENDEGNDYCLAYSSARHELTLGDLRRAKRTLTATERGA